MLPIRSAAALLLTICAGSAAAASFTDAYSSFVVLGDSLSDDGNAFAATGGLIPQSPPYFEGRLSDGPVWAEYLAAEFESAGKLAVNYAFGGATARANGDLIPDLALQAGFAALQSLGDRPLFAMTIGGNDMFDAIDGGADLAIAASGAANAVGEVISGMNFVMGASDFLVLNLPDLSSIPRYALLQPGLVSDAADATAYYNAALSGVLDSLSASLGISVIEVDLASIFTAAVADMDAFGFDDVTTPCLFPDAAIAGAFGLPQFCGDASGKLFFDPVHPTKAGHAIMTEAALAAFDVAPVPLPAGGILLLAGIGMLTVSRRMR